MDRAVVGDSDGRSSWERQSVASPAYPYPLLRVSESRSNGDGDRCAGREVSGRRLCCIGGGDKWVVGGGGGRRTRLLSHTRCNEMAAALATAAAPGGRGGR